MALVGVDLDVRRRRPWPAARRGRGSGSRAGTTCWMRSPRSPCGLRLGFAFDDLASGLGAYTGTRRRMEFKGEVGGVRVYDSYAHHPREIAGDLVAARSLAGAGRVVVAFQPHMVSRTRIFGAEMGAALGRGRRGRGDGRVRRSRGPRARGDRRACRRRGAAGPGARRASSRRGPLSPSTLRAGRAPATWCSPWARVTSPAGPRGPRRARGAWSRRPVPEQRGPDDAGTEGRPEVDDDGRLTSRRRPRRPGLRASPVAAALRRAPSVPVRRTGARPGRTGVWLVFFSVGGDGA